MTNKKPIIGIIPTYALENEITSVYDIDAHFVKLYYNLISKSGGIPIGLLDIDNINDYLSICDGYLWAGGKCIWREYNAIFDDALKNNKPVLGICLGMQAMATYFNVLDDMKLLNFDYETTYNQNKNDNPYLIKLTDDATLIHHHYISNDVETIKKTYHDVFIKPNSVLYDIYKKEIIKEPSMHRFTISRVPSNFVVCASGPCDCIEAIEPIDKSIKFLGVQFHPELNGDYFLFEWLVNNSKKS